MYRVALASLCLRLSSCVCLSAEFFQLRFFLRLRCYIFTIEKVRLLSSFRFADDCRTGAAVSQAHSRAGCCRVFARGGSDTADTACIWYPKPVACPRSTSGRSPKPGRSPNCGNIVCRLSCGLPKSSITVIRRSMAVSAAFFGRVHTLLDGARMVVQRLSYAPSICN